MPLSTIVLHKKKEKIVARIPQQQTIYGKKVSEAKVATTELIKGAIQAKQQAYKIYKNFRKKMQKKKQKNRRKQMGFQ